MRPLYAFLSTLLLGLALSAPLHAAPDAAQFQLTPALLQKLKAVDTEARKAMPPGKDSADDEDDDDEKDDGEDGQTIASIVRKVDATPALKSALAKQGLSSTDFALSVHAMLHAGTYLMFEQSMAKPKAAQLYASYTKAQQANIELLRAQQAAPKR